MVQERAEGPKALSPGQRPGYTRNQHCALQGQKLRIIFLLLASIHLANPNKIGYKAAYIQGFCPYRAQGDNALIPRVLLWARSFWASARA